MHTQHLGNLEERRDLGVRDAGFDLLIGGAADAGGEVDGLLGSVLAYAFDADAVADGASLAGEPLVVIGQGRHVINAVPKIITSQPGLPGIF